MAIHPSKAPKKAEATATRRTVVSLEKFAHRNKADKFAIAAFRDRKDKKRFHTSQALRSYKKVMRKEGYEAGTGASRKRPADGEAAPLRPADDVGAVDGAPARRRRPKMNPFHKALQKAQEKKETIQQSITDKEDREKERTQKLKDRRYRTKVLSKRTKKGQPIMQNMVHDILAKLEKEKQI
jgi:hypothetical protein